MDRARPPPAESPIIKILEGSYPYPFSLSMRCKNDNTISCRAAGKGCSGANLYQPCVVSFLSQKCVYQLSITCSWSLELIYSLVWKRSFHRSLLPTPIVRTHKIRATLCFCWCYESYGDEFLSSLVPWHHHEHIELPSENCLLRLWQCKICS